MSKKNTAKADKQETAAQEAPEQDIPAQDAPQPESAQADPRDEQLALLTKKCDDYLLLAQRVQADFDNYKRRNEGVRAQAYNDGVADALCAMLPLADNFDRALAAIGESEAGKSVRDGVMMVKKQFDDALASKGVAPIDSSEGTPFDPAVHNAIMTAPADDEHKSDTIAATFQKGFTLAGKVIRYAMVSVYK